MINNIVAIHFNDIMMMWAANTEGKTEWQISNSNSAGAIGLFFLLWIILLVWFVFYKIYKRISKFRVKKQLLKNQKDNINFFNKKEDWEE